MNAKYPKFISLVVLLFLVIDPLWNSLPIAMLPPILQNICANYFSSVFFVILFVSFSTTLLWRIPGINVFLSRFLYLNQNISGTWEGKIEYEYDGKTQTKDAYLVICQPNGLSIKATLFTNERTSHSDNEVLKQEDGRTLLCYTYQPDDAVKNKETNSIHTGSSILCIDKTSSRFSMKGIYYTSRKSTGEMSFRKRTSKRAESYQSAQTICGVRVHH